MLTSLRLANYRGFESYKLSGLSRVNLLVGKNGCGKTSILEGIQILVLGEDPRGLGAIARRRGEVFLPGDEEQERLSSHNGVPDVSHFFHGHTFGPGASFTLTSDDGPGELAVRVLRMDEIDPQRDLLKETGKRFGAYGLRFELTGRGSTPKLPVFPVSEDGAFAFLADRTGYARHMSDLEGGDYDKVQLIDADSVTPSNMRAMWDKALFEGAEPDVEEAMRILEPSLTSISFLSAPLPPKVVGATGILVGLEGLRQRVPLGSYGEGMRRLLVLSLSLVQTRGGILLIDEIDAGLHWSVMADMWRLVIRTAVNLDMNVFATTHSLDCIRGLAEACENHPDLRGEVSVQKIERRLDHSVALDATDISIAARQDIEVR